MKNIILFDGECNLCNRGVQLIIKRDPNGFFSFCSLQSQTGEMIREKYSVSPQIDSIVLIYQEKVFLKSSAVLKIVQYLKGPIRLLCIGYIIPPMLRDFMYDLIANRRYRWFGRRDTCMVPSEDILNRFLFEE
jgi:predicted DCC family thiol-disulfide oxidoreductase YuxK